MRAFLLLFLWVVLIDFTFAQTLPRGLSLAEQELVRAGLIEKPRSIPGAITARSTGNIRAMAEWEELQAIVIAWTSFPAILTEIVRAAQPECEVFIVCRNEQSVRNTLNNAGIDPDQNIDYIVEDFNTIWIRDYGANPAYINAVDTLVMIDWIYNRPRPDDDAVPGIIAQHLDVPLYSTTEPPNDLVHTGGNFMSDGMGQGFSSRLILDENDATNIWGISNHSEADVDAIMQEFLGIRDYIKMTNLPYDLIHHIDMHMKLLDEETLLVGEYPEGVADGPQIEANIQYVLEQFQTSFGQPFRVVRIPMPPDFFGRFPNNGGDYRTYTNSLFVNNTILVPIYQERYDTTALRIWREEMPGYRIVGIDCNDIIPLSGAIHCITKEVGVDEPLLINHGRPESVLADEPVLVEITARHHSDIASATIYYRVAGEDSYQSAAMEYTFDDQWEVVLPGFPAETQLQYYFSATANNGKSVNRPLPAPKGFFEIEVEQSSVSTTNFDQAQIEFTGVFPNPATAMTCIPIKSSFQFHGQINLLDLFGRQVMTIYAGTIESGESKYFFHAGDMPAGQYFLELRSNLGTAVQKLQIK